MDEEKIFTIKDYPIYPEKIYWISGVEDYVFHDDGWFYGFDIRYMNGTYDRFKWPKHVNKDNDKVLYKYEQLKIFRDKIVHLLKTDGYNRKYYLGSENINDNDIKVFADYCYIAIKYEDIKMHPQQMLHGYQVFNDVPIHLKSNEALIKSASELWHVFKNELPEVNKEAIERKNLNHVRKIHANLLDVWRPNWQKVPLDES